MNYQLIYNNLIQAAQLRPDIEILNGYTETHHIIPRSIGGGDVSDNLVKLTAREHFIAHWLLWKIFKNTEHEIKMMYAFNMMRTNRYERRYYNSHAFDVVRKSAIEAQKGKKLSEEHKLKIGQASKGRKHSPETRAKMSEKQKIASINRKPISADTRKKMSENRTGKKYTDEHCRNISRATKGKKRSEESCKHISEGQKGKIMSDETRKKISETHTGMKRSAEVCRKISESKRGKKRKPFTEEHIRKLKEAKRLRDLSNITLQTHQP